jgi:hypothetical protein
MPNDGYREGRSPDWLKSKNPTCEAVWREAVGAAAWSGVDFDGVAIAVAHAHDGFVMLSALAGRPSRYWLIVMVHLIGQRGLRLSSGMTATRTRCGT